MVLAIFLGVVPRSVTAQPCPSADPGLDVCLAAPGASTSAAMAKCLAEADARWSERMDRAYHRLRTRLDPLSRRLLDQSQHAWVAFRAAELAFLRGPWRVEQGTFAPLNLAELQLAELRARTLALESYLPQP